MNRSLLPTRRPGPARAPEPFRAPTTAAGVPRPGARPFRPARKPGGRAPEQGQALVEFALVAPVLILVLLGLAYCGVLVLKQQELAIQARAASRQVALDAVKAMLSDPQGRQRTVSGANFLKAAGNPAGMQARAGSFKGGALSGKRGDFMRTVTQTTSISIGGKKYTAGIGAVVYGVTLEQPVDVRFLSTVIPSIGASAATATELPLRGTGAQNPGIMELNPWIREIVNEPYRSK